MQSARCTVLYPDICKKSRELQVWDNPTQRSKIPHCDWLTKWCFSTLLQMSKYSLWLVLEFSLLGTYSHARDVQISSAILTGSYCLQILAVKLGAVLTTVLDTDHAPFVKTEWMSQWWDLKMSPGKVEAHLADHSIALWEAECGVLPLLSRAHHKIGM